MKKITLCGSSICLLVVALGLDPAVAQDIEKKQTDSTSASTADADQTPEIAEKPKAYEFTTDNQIETTAVKSQGSTGTCWCFASTSFIESELLRMGKGQLDLSEMFIVKNVYRNKARNFVLRQGKANFGEGALAHDFMNAALQHGVVPEGVFNGLLGSSEKHDHGEMFDLLDGVVQGVVKRRNHSAKWMDAFGKVMDVYMGPSPAEFSFQGKTYTPMTFAAELGLKPDDYVNLTSYTHHPFGKPFVLEIPDNFSNGSFQNVPIDEIVSTIDHAIGNGYSVAWDGDVSERGFSRNNGIAILPKDPKRKDVFKEPGEEIEVTQELRQSTLENFSTTDDHLMHLTGIAHDQNGTKYYLIKNSWGGVGPHDGYLYMSEAYLRLKTVAILLHKDALPAKTATDQVSKPST